MRRGAKLCRQRRSRARLTCSLAALAPVQPRAKGIDRKAPKAAQYKVFNGDCAGAKALVDASLSCHRCGGLSVRNWKVQKVVVVAKSQ